MTGEFSALEVRFLADLGISAHGLKNKEAHKAINEALRGRAVSFERWRDAYEIAWDAMKGERLRLRSERMS